MTNESILELKNLCVSFDGFRAVSDANVQVEEGKVHVIIGPNGAGKSTLMDLITGKTKPTSGEILFKGKHLEGLEPGVISSKYHVGRKFQGPNVFSEMTVYENIEIALAGYTTLWKAFLYRRKKNREKIKELLQLIQLWDQREYIVSELSHGQQQWLEIGMVMAQSPELIILDEPAAGMTDKETNKTAELVRELAGEHTLIVIEHDMEFVEEIADEVTVLHQGTVIANGTFEQVRKDPKVISVYLQDENGEGF